MVIIKGMLASLVANPKMSEIEQRNSTNTARLNDNAGLMPITPGNWTSPPAKKVWDLGQPCTSIIAPIPILKMSSTTYLACQKT